MQKNIWQQLVAVIISIWALWNYEITLSLLGSALGILMPLITGCVIAFTVNVFIEKFEQIWMRVLKDRAARFRGPVCLIAGFMLIFGVITALLFAVLPELHASIVILSHKLPQDYFNAFLQEQLLAWNFSPEDVAYVQDKIYEWQAAVEDYWQANKTALLSQTLSITASVAGVVANLVMGFVFAVYILLEKKQLAVSSRRALYAFCSAERARYIIAAASLAKRICSGFIGGQLLEAFLLGLMCFAGQLLEAFLLGLMCFAGMIILGIPYAFVISALVACLAVVPYIGSITSAVIGCIFIVISQPEKVIVFIIFFLVLQRIEGDILYPRIVGKSVGLPELWLLVAAMIGAGLGGIMGMIISVPLCSVFYALFSDYIKRRLQTKKMNDI